MTRRPAAVHVPRSRMGASATPSIVTPHPRGQSSVHVPCAPRPNQTALFGPQDRSSHFSRSPGKHRFRRSQLPWQDLVRSNSRTFRALRGSTS